MKKISSNLQSTYLLEQHQSRTRLAHSTTIPHSAPPTSLRTHPQPVSDAGLHVPQLRAVDLAAARIRHRPVAAVDEVGPHALGLDGPIVAIQSLVRHLWTEISNTHPCEVCLSRAERRTLSIRHCKQSLGRSSIFVWINPLRKSSPAVSRRDSTAVVIRDGVLRTTKAVRFPFGRSGVCHHTETLVPVLFAFTRTLSGLDASETRKRQIESDTQDLLQSPPGRTQFFCSKKSSVPPPPHSTKK